MRINHNEQTYLFCESNKINFLVDNIEKDDFIQCLYEFFGKKKKNYCQVFNHDNERILCDEIEFIYLPYSKATIDSNFNLKQKSFFNIEFSNFINQNPIKFQSIDNIRENIHSLLTDSGFFDLIKILSNGIPEQVNLRMDEFDTGKIIEMLEISQDNLTDDIKYIIAYNLVLYLNRKKNCIVYIDFPITSNVLKWLNKQESLDTIFLINNNFIEPCYNCIDSCSFIKLSNQDFIESFEFNHYELQYIAYTFHPFVQQNIELQNEKIFNYFNQFDDNQTTFYLTFSNINSKISDK